MEKALQAHQVCFSTSYSDYWGLNNWVYFESVALDHLTHAFQAQLGEFVALHLDVALLGTLNLPDLVHSEHS